MTSGKKRASRVDARRLMVLFRMRAPACVAPCPLRAVKTSTAQVIASS